MSNLLASHNMPMAMDCMSINQIGRKRGHNDIHNCGGIGCNLLIEEERKIRSCLGVYRIAKGESNHVQ